MKTELGYYKERRNERAKARMMKGITFADIDYLFRSADRDLARVLEEINGYRARMDEAEGRAHQMQAALLKVLEMAQRSDAHPDMDFARVAKEGLGIE